MKSENEQPKIETLILGDMYKQAVSAYSGMSHWPEKAAEQLVRDYSTELESDLASIPEEERARYKSNYRQKLFDWLGAKARCFSSFISGPSNYPVRQQEKRRRSEDNKYNEFREWRGRALKVISKQVLASRTPQEVSDEKWKSIKQSITSSAATIIKIDTGIERGLSRPLFVNSIVGLVQRLAKNGDVENVDRALAYLKELDTVTKEKFGSEKPIISSRSSVWELGAKAEVSREQQVDRAAQENTIEEFGEVKIVKNYRIDRLQIVFPGKPDDATRGKMKSSGFRWSPAEMAWQRKLTNNAEYDAKRILREVGVLNETNDAESLGRMAMHG